MSNVSSINGLEKRVPRLRFPGFEGEWEEYLLSDLFSKITRKNTYGTISNVICNSAKLGLIPQREYFDKDIANEDNTNGYYVIEKGDFVYNPRKSNEAPYGPVSVYKYKEQGIVSPLYLCFSPIKSIETAFFLWYFKSPVWHRYVYLAGDSGVRHDRVSMKDSIFFSMPLNIPTQTEQQKIATFFTLLDKRIAKQRELVESLKSYKRGVLSAIFSRKIRFKDKNGNEFPKWEKHSIGYYMSSKVIKQTPTESAPLMAFIADIGVAFKGDRYDRSYLVKSDDKLYKRTDYNDFIYSSNNLDVGSIGLNLYGSAVISDVYEIFHINNFAIPSVICAAIRQPAVLYEVVRLRQGVMYGQYRIYADEFLNVPIELPCYEEQNKIAMIIEKIDFEISIEEQLLLELENYKNNILGDMFI